MTSADNVPEQPKRILYLSDLQWACAWYRCHTPGMALRERGHEVRLQDTLEFEDIDWCDVLVVQRVAEPALERAFEYARSRGKLVVYDLDDDLWSIPAANEPAREYWTHERLGDMARSLRSADRVTTSSEPLRKLLLAYNRDVRVIPNMLPADHWPAAAKDLAHPAPLVIGWAGGTSHHDDLREVGDVFGQVLERHPDVEVHLAGAQESWFSPHERLRFLESVPLEQYAALLAGFDIAVAPLHANRFNESKSDLKLLEYSMVGLAVVASRVTPYSTSVRPAETGFLARNSKDWLKYLSALIEDPSLRASAGIAARRWAETRTAERNVELWESAYDATP